MAIKLRCPSCDRENVIADSTVLKDLPEGTLKCLGCGEKGVHEWFQPTPDALVDKLEGRVADMISMGKDNPHRTAREIIRFVREAMNSAQ